MQKLILALLVCSRLAYAAELSLSDVSILLPLPQGQEAESLPGPQFTTRQGELLPRTLLKNFANITVHMTEEEVYEKLRVVAIRLDPCFPSPKALQRCQPQIRFTWQPLEKDFKNEWRTVDAAVHTFYDLSAEQFRNLIQDLRKLKNNHGVEQVNAPLNVHPLLQREGLMGRNSREFLGRILNETGFSRMSRFAFMLLRGGGQVWTFGGFDILGGEIKRIVIPRINRPVQAFFNLAMLPTYYEKGGITPTPQGPDIVNLLVQDSAKISKNDEPQILEAALAAYRIENPLVHNPNTVDCASCHVTQAARMWADQNFPQLRIAERAKAVRFNSKYNLTNMSPDPGSTARVRGFGYDGLAPAISQRVINETAIVLETIANF